MAWYEGWIPVSIIRRTVSHLVGFSVTLGAFYMATQLTAEVVEVEWVREGLDKIEEYLVLALGLMLALDLFVPLFKEFWHSSFGESENGEA